MLSLVLLILLVCLLFEVSIVGFGFSSSWFGFVLLFLDSVFGPGLGFRYYFMLLLLFSFSCSL